MDKVVREILAIELASAERSVEYGEKHLAENEKRYAEELEDRRKSLEVSRTKVLKIRAALDKEKVGAG